MSRKAFPSAEGSDAENLPSTSHESELISSTPTPSVKKKPRWQDLYADRDSESDVYDSDVDPLYLHHSDGDSDSSSSDDGDVRKRKTPIKKRKNNGSKERSVVVGEEGMPIGRSSVVDSMREEEEGGVSEAAAVPEGEEGSSGNGADISEGEEVGDADEPDPEQRPRGRKAPKQVELWARNIAKKKRNLGQEYVSEKTKNVVAARKVGPPCSDGCYDKLGMEKIHAIVTNFWGMGDYDRQNQYLIGCISEEQHKRKYTKEAVSKRPVTIIYTVTHACVSYNVCRTAFMNIHDIKRKKMDIVLEKRRQAKAQTGVADLDMRGKTVDPINKIFGPKTDAIHQFIRTLPVMSSHYSRAKAPHAQYLPFGGNVSSLYQEYLVFMEVSHPHVATVKESFFRSVFTRSYNIRFAHPKVDECNFCCELDVKISSASDGEAKEALKEKKQKHLDEAEAARVLLNDPDNTTEREGFRAIAIDLQQQQPIPKMPVNRSYYTSKLWFLNFCIFDLTKNTPHMFVWDETVAKRGPNEIGSCILRWLKHVRETEGKVIDTLRIFCDNCAGQNKNIFNVVLFLQQIQKKLLNRVEFSFLVSGHSFLPCDRTFGVIEKMYRRHSYICSTQKYTHLLQSAGKKKKFDVFEMRREHFYDIKALSTLITNRSAGQLAKAKQFVIDASEPEGFFIKNDYGFAADPGTFISLRKGRQPKSGRGRPKITLRLDNKQLEFKYQTEVALKKSKVISLSTLIPMIPTPNEKQWLSDLISHQNTMLAMNPGTTHDSDDEIEEDLDNPDNTQWTERSVLYNPDSDDDDLA